MTVLVTGAAGFIGMHVADALLARGETVLGIDNLNPYYDVSLKRARLDRLGQHRNFRFELLDIADGAALRALVRQNRAIDRIVNLAAQAGVRYSLTHPEPYVATNVAGHLNVLESCRALDRLDHLVYASSSSVYGANTKMPFAIEDRVDRPVSLYAATKRAGELISYSYGHLYGFPQTGLRFFTVYGPWGRPDMSAYLFTKAIIAGEPIRVFNHGDMRRARRVAAAALQSRQSSRRAALAVHRGDRGGGRTQGRAEARADAARGRQGDVRRHRGEPARPRLRAAHADRSRHTALRRLVPPVSRRLILHPLAS